MSISFLKDDIDQETIFESFKEIESWHHFYSSCHSTINLHRVIHEARGSIVVTRGGGGDGGG